MLATECLPEQLWCCGSPFEMNEAANRRLPIHGAASIRYIKQLKKDFEHFAEYLGSGENDQDAAFQLLGEQLQVDTRAAQCGNPADEAMIRAKIEALGSTKGSSALVGYKLLDATIFKMRMDLVRAFMAPAPAPIVAASPSTNTTSVTSVSEDCIRGMVQRIAKLEVNEEAALARMAKLDEENLKLRQESTIEMAKLEEENANLKQRLEALENMCPKQNNSAQ